MAIGPWEIVIILLVLVVIFGAGRLAQIGNAFGRSVREFRSASKEQPAVVTSPPVICPTCQAANTATNRFCSACGGSLTIPPTAEMPVAVIAAPEKICPSCATANPPGQAFCGQCGTKLTSEAA